jgi:histidinol-phosphatase (PHP family)
MTVGSSGEGVTDLAAYAAAVRALKNEYADRIYVSVGIECGHTRANEQKNAALLKDAGIEYVINSVHEVNGSDIYLDSHYMNRSKRNVYTEYLEAVLQSLYAPYKFAALGHAGYMSRRAPYADNALTYSEFPVLTDAVIDRLIKTETILEINTARGRSASAVLPDPSVLARYYERGGRLVTLGSDAHRISELCRGFDGARILARGIGFTEFTLIQNDNFKAVRI